MELLSPDFLFRNAIAAGWVVCVLCSVLGVYVALRRMVLLGVALPQAGAAGIACVFLLTHHVHGEGGRAHWAVGGRSARPSALVLPLSEPRLAPLSSGARGSGDRPAATLLFVALNPMGDLEMTSLLRGELLATSSTDLAIVSVVAALVMVVFVLFRREILLVSFDAEFARTIGRDPTRWDALLYLLLGVTISVGVMTAGPMVVLAFLVLPALAARRVTTHLAATFLVSAAIATFCSTGGFAIAYRADLPAGPVYVLLAAGIWVLAGLFGRLRSRIATVALLYALLAGLPALSGCGWLQTPDELAAKPAEHGSLPELGDTRAVAVAPFRNETGQSLRIAGANPLDELARAAGRAPSQPPLSVLDLLQAHAARELARRGYSIAPADSSRPAGVTLTGTLRRFSRQQDDSCMYGSSSSSSTPRAGRSSGRASRAGPSRCRAQSRWPRSPKTRRPPSSPRRSRRIDDPRRAWHARAPWSLNTRTRRSFCARTRRASSRWPIRARAGSSTTAPTRARSCRSTTCTFRSRSRESRRAACSSCAATPPSST
jgi:ABC-type Mn2+/Zn2+ transport system permease subunit